MHSMQATKTAMPTSSRRPHSSRQADASRADDAPVDGLRSIGAPWHASVVTMGIASAVLMWLALPPVDWGWFGWFAPVGWLLLIRSESLGGWRPYLKLYAVGWVYFGVTFYWVTLPHVSAFLGWIALTTYLAFYIVLFVGLSRVAVHQLRVPLLLAAPIVWTGLELVRAHFATGFLLAALAHTQHHWITVIQISDLVGAYGLSFLVMLIAACLARVVPIHGQRTRIWPLLSAALALIAAIAYGQYRLQYEGYRAGPKIALVQGSIDTEFGVDPMITKQKIDLEYVGLTLDVLSKHDDIDLVVWPESMCTNPLITIENGAWLPAEITAQWPSLDPGDADRLEAARELPKVIHEFADHTRVEFQNLTRYLSSQRRGSSPSSDDAATTGRPLRLLVGVDGERYGPGWLRRYNTSAFLGPDGHVADQYSKMHPVMFGEYVPLGDLFPSLYRLTPLAGGLTAGTEAKAFEVAGARLAPNICYETVLPHVIRRQVVMLKDAGREPDVLVTQTNDGWFWGSAALDMHLICGLFRAVECRKPLLIAANTGLSASIDSSGNILQQGPRRATETLVVQPRIDSRQSPYLTLGDWFAWACATSCACLLVAGTLGRRKRHGSGRNDHSDPVNAE